VGIMSNSHRDSIRAKFRKGLIDYGSVSQAVKSMWNRHNNDKGYFRALRLKIKEKITNKLNKNHE
jgi:hypothetical protein